MTRKHYGFKKNVGQYKRTALTGPEQSLFLVIEIALLAPHPSC